MKYDIYAGMGGGFGGGRWWWVVVMEEVGGMEKEEEGGNFGRNEINFGLYIEGLRLYLEKMWLQIAATLCGSSKWLVD